MRRPMLLLAFLTSTACSASNISVGGSSGATTGQASTSGGGSSGTQATTGGSTGAAGSTGSAPSTSGGSTGSTGAGGTSGAASNGSSSSSGTSSTSAGSSSGSSGGSSGGSSTGGLPCASGCTTPPAPYCLDPNTQVSFDASTGCINGFCNFQTAETACPYGCQNGTCAAPQACTPGQTRCSGTQVEVCNPTGSAWLFQENCPTTCTTGLCDAPCTADAGRCSGNTPQTCNAGGTAWVNGTACATACLDGTCLQSDLTVDGNTVVMSGAYHYSNSVVVQNGGSIQVGDAGWLAIYAPTIDVEISSSIGGGGNAACLGAPPDAVSPGISLVGSSQVTVDGTVTWSGNCPSGGVLIRADAITGSGAVNVNVGKNLQLYGAGGIVATLTATGIAPTKSLMPPNVIASAEYPAGGVYNDDGPPPSFTWDDPYTTVAGYYYVFSQTSSVPKATSTLDSTETLSLPTPPVKGTNYLDVISFDSQGFVGTVPHEFEITVNSAPPTLSSSTNPVQGAYTTNTAVIMAWDGGNDGTGYYYAFDDFPTTHPTAATGTFASPSQTPQVLLQNVGTGRQWFHIIAADTMGYLTKAATHYEIDIGAAPDAGTIGTIAGTVVDQTNTPIVGATVILQRSLASETTVAGGVYTFGATIPAGTYEVVASATGMQSQQIIANVTAGATADANFQLQPGTGCPTCSDVCSAVYCSESITSSVSCTDGVEQVQAPWPATCDQGVCAATVAYNYLSSTGSCGSLCETENEGCQPQCGTNVYQECSNSGLSYYCCSGQTCQYVADAGTYQCL